MTKPLLVSLVLVPAILIVLPLELLYRLVMWLLRGERFYPEWSAALVYGLIVVWVWHR